MSEQPPPPGSDGYPPGPPTAPHDGPLPGPTPPPPPPPGPPPRRGRSTALVVTLSIVGALVVGGIVTVVLAGLSGNADRNDAGEITNAGEVSAFDVHEGDCFDLPDPGQAVYDVGGVPCSQPHDAEVYGVFDLQGNDFPGHRKVIRQAERGCTRRFADFVGMPYRKSELELQYLYPTKDSWNRNDDREVVCAVTEPKGKKTKIGTLEGAER